MIVTLFALFARHLMSSATILPVVPRDVKSFIFSSCHAPSLFYLLVRYSMQVTIPITLPPPPRVVIIYITPGLSPLPDTINAGTYGRGFQRHFEAFSRQLDPGV